MDKPDYSEQFASLLKSPLGKELIKTLTDLRSSKLEDAENNGDASLLNQAYGIRLAIVHLQRRAIVPKVVGGKGNK